MHSLSPRGDAADSGVAGVAAAAAAAVGVPGVPCPKKKPAGGTGGGGLGLLDTRWTSAGGRARPSGGCVGGGVGGGGVGEPVWLSLASGVRGDVGVAAGTLAAAWGASAEGALDGAAAAAAAGAGAGSASCTTSGGVQTGASVSAEGMQFVCNGCMLTVSFPCGSGMDVTAATWLRVLLSFFL